MFAFFLEGRLLFNVFYTGILLYVCKQTFRKSNVCISQKGKRVVIRNLRDNIFYIKIYIILYKDIYIFI